MLHPRSKGNHPIVPSGALGELIRWNQRATTSHLQMFRHLKRVPAQHGID